MCSWFDGAVVVVRFLFHISRIFRSPLARSTLTSSPLQPTVHKVHPICTINLHAHRLIHAHAHTTVLSPTTRPHHLRTTHPDPPLHPVFHSTGGTTQFIPSAAACTSECFGQLDVVVLMDESSTIDSDEWLVELDFLRAVANQFDIQVRTWPVVASIDIHDRSRPRTPQC